MITELPPQARSLLLRCCRTRLAPAALDAVADLAARIDNWKDLVSAASQERLDGLLYVQLQRAGAADSPDPDSAQILRQQYEQTAVENLERIGELLLIRKQSAAAGIPFALLKGMALLATTYEDIGLRAMGDIDLWVRPDDCSRFSAMLVSAGYEQDRLYPDTFRKNRTVIDLHSHPLGADRIRFRKFLLRTEAAVMFRRTQPARLMGEFFFCPADFDHVMILSIHALKHGFYRLVWMADLLNLTSDWEKQKWEAFRKWCEKTGGEKLVGRTFAAMDAFFLNQEGKLLNPSMKDWMPARMDRKILMLRLDQAELPFWAPTWLMRPPGSIIVASLYFLETLFPKPAVLRQIFPKSASSPALFLYFLRIFQILSWAVRRSS